jgi:hypothetical protein
MDKIRVWNKVLHEGHKTHINGLGDKGESVSPVL